MTVLFRVTHRRTLAPKSFEQVNREHEMLMEELEDEKSYRKMIKNRCFICSLWFLNSWEHYITYGNCCRVCTGRVIRVRFSSKLQPSGKRNRIELTREESNNLLAVRRNYIFEHQLNLPPSQRRKKNRYALPPEEL